MRNALLWLLRIYSYLYHLLLCLFLLAVGFLAVSINPSELQLDMLPWTGATLTRAVVMLGGAGLLCVLPAMVGKLRWLFPIWALFAFILMFRGFFLSGYSFDDASHFRQCVWLTAGAFVAFVGSLTVLRRKPSGRR